MEAHGTGTMIGSVARRRSPGAGRRPGRPLPAGRRPGGRGRPGRAGTAARTGAGPG
ncbi:hypothetical protein ACWC9T_38395 [Kitasatospora sp. NPDC001159]